MATVSFAMTSTRLAFSFTSGCSASGSTEPPRAFVTKKAMITIAHEPRLSSSWTSVSGLNAICTSTAKMPTVARIERNGNPHILILNFDGSVRRRSTICEMPMSR